MHLLAETIKTTQHVPMIVGCAKAIEKPAATRGESRDVVGTSGQACDMAHAMSYGFQTSQRRCNQRYLCARAVTDPLLLRVARGEGARRVSSLSPSLRLSRRQREKHTKQEFVELSIVTNTFVESPGV